MNIRPHYSAAFYRGEVERLTGLLKQAISDRDRVSYQHQLASARAHLADLEKAETGSTTGN